MHQSGNAAVEVALMKEIPLPLLQRWMGHADLETTAIYLQVNGNEEKSFAGRMWEEASEVQRNEKLR